MTTRQALDRVLREHSIFEGAKHAALLDALVAALPETPTETEARYREVVDRDRHAYLRGAEDGGCAAWITGGWCTRPEDHPMHAASPREAPTDQRLRDENARLREFLALRPSGFTGPLDDRIPWFQHCGISHGTDRPDCVVCRALATEGEPTTPQHMSPADAERPAAVHPRSVGAMLEPAEPPVDQGPPRRVVPDSPAPEPTAPRETLDDLAWLIERGQSMGQVPPVWWISDSRWTADAFKATRFGSREAAEAVILERRGCPLVSCSKHCPPFGVAIEHGFIRAAAPIATESREGER